MPRARKHHCITHQRLSYYSIPTYVSGYSIFLPKCLYIVRCMPRNQCQRLLCSILRSQRATHLHLVTGTSVSHSCRRGKPRCFDSKHTHFGWLVYRTMHTHRQNPQRIGAPPQWAVPNIPVAQEHIHTRPVSTTACVVCSLVRVQKSKSSAWSLCMPLTARSRGRGRGQRGRERRTHHAQRPCHRTRWERTPQQCGREHTP
jgi:hypothetical protein